MVLDHVAQRADLVVVARARPDALLLGRGDEDRFDQVAIPHGFEQRVREPEGEDVLDGVLGQVVVDAEDLLLVERGSELRVQLSRRGEVVAEWFLDDDPAGRVAFRSHARVANGAKDVGESLGRRGEVEDRGLDAVEQILHRRKGSRIPVAQLHPFGGGRELSAAAGLADQIPKFVARLLAAARADHAQRRSVARRKVLQRRQDLAARQVSRRSEDDEVDVRGHG